jgi:DNA polymerase-1
VAVDLTEVLQVLRKVPIFSIDFETGGFDPLKHRITWISLSAGDDLSWAIPFVGPNAFNFVRTMTLLDPFLRAPEKEKVLHNAKFDLKFARRAELDFGGQLIDTCIASFLLDENRSSHALDVLVKEHFGYEMGKYEAVGGLFEGTTMMEGYSRDDAEWTLKLWKKLKPMLKRERLLRMFMELECEVVPVLADMELAGVAVDVDYMEGLRDYMAKAVDRLALQSFDVAGMTFDINSSQEVSELLYGKFNVRPPKRTRIDVVEGRKKWLSTEKEVLEQVSEQHPVIEVILEYRK